MLCARARSSGLVFGHDGSSFWDDDRQPSLAILGKLDALRNQLILWLALIVARFLSGQKLINQYKFLLKAEGNHGILDAVLHILDLHLELHS